jgi:hypothetical protein
MEARHNYINLFLFLLFQFILQNLLYLFNPDLSIFYCLSIPILPDYNLRDSKDRFRSPKQKELKHIIPLSKEVMDPLIGNLLGDGSLLINKKGVDGLPKPISNANFCYNLKKTNKKTKTRTFALYPVALTPKGKGYFCILTVAFDLFLF